MASTKYVIYSERLCSDSVWNAEIFILNSVHVVQEVAKAKVDTCNTSSIMYDLMLQARAGSKSLHPQETRRLFEVTNVQDSKPSTEAAEI